MFGALASYACVELFPRFDLAVRHKKKVHILLVSCLIGST